MAGAPALPGNTIPGTPIDYGSGYSTLQAPMQAPSGLFNGLGPAQLNTSALPLQSYTPEYNITQTGGGSFLPVYNVTGNGTNQTEIGNNNIQQFQNSNTAGYQATQQANAENLGYLQQAAIAQNRLLGELNSRGLLNSFENGGAGTVDFQQLQNSLDNAANTQGASLQNELSGLNQQDAMYQMALANYNNEYGQFNQYKQNNQPGLLDVIGTGISALPLIPGI